MQKYLAALIMICLVPVLAIAGPGDQMGDSYFSHKNPKLTPEEQTGIGIADRWRASSATGTKAVAGTDGSVQFCVWRLGAEHPLRGASGLRRGLTAGRTGQ